MPFSKVEPEKMSHAVVRQVERLILQGVLRPGDRLPPERTLAERMEVSRPTLREALSELEGRGLTEVRPGGGTFVADTLGSAFAPELIELFATHDAALFDYLSFRRDLEGLAAERAARNATAADLEVISSVFSRLEAAAARDDRAAAAEIDAEFHMAVVDAAHNIVLTHVMRSLSELLLRGVFYNRSVVYGLPEGCRRLMAQHRAIHDAVTGRRPADARAAVEAHLDYVRGALAEADRIRSREEVADLRRRYEAVRAARPRRRRAANGARQAAE